MPWSEPATLAGVAAFAVVVSAIGGAWAIVHAHRNDLFDHPGERRSHAHPTPRGGGLGIGIACLAALLAVGRGGPAQASWLLAASGLLMVAAIGWWDDHRPLPAWPRLLVHAVAAACLAAALHLQGAGLIGVVAAFLLALVLVNAWNFMDGINGLAASQGLLCALGFAGVLGGAWRLVAVAVAGACLGFLPHNFPRARVFLGDVGSGALGYMLAALLAAGMASQPVAAWPLLLLPPMAMLADGGLTLLWRMSRGERWWQPHVQHSYQRWSRHHGHARVTLAYAVWTFVAVAIMLAALDWPARAALAAALAVLLASAWAWWRLHLRYGKNTEGFGT
ncbi:MAG: lipopolysaccharide biosynthesis protein [Lysobacteraceae bacterium]|nr:MAG: lipopolysaccharide biosynthesis protein [Xanthomonadaceae bacterium]